MPDADTKFRSPWFGELNKAECRGLLSRTSVGRLAYVLGDRVEIIPIQIAFDSDCIYGRTSAGSRLSAIREGTNVALEVDEHRGPFDWLSVVVHGAFTLLTPEEIVASESPDLIALEKFYSNALSEDDPIPFRNQFFRIRVSEITGRYAQPTGGRRREPGPSQ